MVRTRTALAKAAQPATPVNFDVPAGACDCHTHIHGDPEKFPFFPGRVYTPETALPEEMAALHRALRMRRVVIVTPSVYGTDNSATLWGMKARGADARGVAVIDDKTPESELDAMGRAGVRGIRLKLGAQADRTDAALPGRRRPGAESSSGVGVRCRDPEEDPRGQSGEALRVLSARRSARPWCSLLRCSSRKARGHSRPTRRTSPRACAFSCRKEIARRATAGPRTAARWT